MKLSDIQINAEYACGGPREKTTRLRDRVRVIEIGEFRKDRWGCHARRKRAKVVCLDRETGATIKRPNGDPVTKVVDAQELLRPWQVEQDRYDDQQERDRVRKNRARERQQDKDAAYEEVFDLCRSMGLAGTKTYEWAEPGREWKDFQFRDGVEISDYNEHNVVMSVETFRDVLLTLQGLDARTIFGKEEK